MSSVRSRRISMRGLSPFAAMSISMPWRPSSRLWDKSMWKPFFSMKARPLQRLSDYRRVLAGAHRVVGEGPATLAIQGVNRGEADHLQVHDNHAEVPGLMGNAVADPFHKLGPAPPAAFAPVINPRISQVHPPAGLAEKPEPKPTVRGDLSGRPIPGLGGLQGAMTAWRKAYRNPPTPPRRMPGKGKSGAAERAPADTRSCLRSILVIFSSRQIIVVIIVELVAS